MGTKKTTSKTTPYDPASINRGTGALHSTYDAQMPKVTQIADNLTGMLPDMMAKYKAGNPAVNAASDYVTSTLGGDGTNPNLDAYIAQTQDEAQNRVGASINKLGLGPAGSTYQGAVGREVGKIGLGMRYDDWNQGQQRKAQAAGMAPGLAAADVIQVAPMLSTAQLGANLPMDTANRYAAGIGGLLSPYSTTEQKQSGGLGSMLGGLLGAGLSGWASGGFAGFGRGG